MPARRDRARADVVEAALVVVQAEEERRERVRAGLPAHADDHAVGRPVRLHLDHPVARSGKVGQAEALRDHAVEPGGLQPFEPALGHALVPCRGRDRERQRLERRTPLLERAGGGAPRPPRAGRRMRRSGRGCRRTASGSGSRPGEAASASRRSRGGRPARSRSRRRGRSGAEADRRPAAAPGSSGAAAGRSGSRAPGRLRRSRGRRGIRPTSARTASRRREGARGRAPPPSAGRGRASPAHRGGYFSQGARRSSMSRHPRGCSRRARTAGR